MLLSKAIETGIVLTQPIEDYECEDPIYTTSYEVYASCVGAAMVGLWGIATALEMSVDTAIDKLNELYPYLDGPVPDQSYADFSVSQWLTELEFFTGGCDRTSVANWLKGMGW